MDKEEITNDGEMFCNWSYKAMMEYLKKISDGHEKININLGIIDLWWNFTENYLLTRIL